MTTMIAKQKADSYLSLWEIPPGYLNITGMLNNYSPDSGISSWGVVWLQGCMRNCINCSNSRSQSFAIDRLISVDSLAKIIINPHNRGVTFSGGEPFWQAPALVELAKQAKTVGLNVMAFSCFSLERLQSPYAPAKSRELLEQLDVLVENSYMESIPIDSQEFILSQKRRAHIFDPGLKASMSNYLRMVYSIEDFV